MTADRDITRIVRSWLRTDERDSADRVLETVLSRLDTTPQRRRFLPVWRLPDMNNTTRIALGAVAVIVVAILGYNLLPRSGTVGGPAVPAPVRTALPTATASPIPSLAITRLNSQPTLGGRYLVGSGLRSEVTIQVPADWSANGDWVVRGPRGHEAPNGMAIRFYPVQSVYKNPAALSEGFIEPAVGPTVDDLVNAIVDHPSWMSSEPTDIIMAGFQGQLVRVTIPNDAPLASDGSFFLFADGVGGQIFGWEPGQAFDLRIVDVAGERIVVDAFSYPGTSEEDLRARQAALDSIEIKAAP